MFGWVKIQALRQLFTIVGGQQSADPESVCRTTRLSAAADRSGSGRERKVKKDFGFAEKNAQKA